MSQKDRTPRELIAIARQRLDNHSTHWEGCELDHNLCLIQRLADALERAQNKLDADMPLHVALSSLEAERAANRELRDERDRLRGCWSRRRER